MEEPKKKSKGILKSTGFVAFGAIAALVASHFFGGGGYGGFGSLFNLGGGGQQESGAAHENSNNSNEAETLESQEPNGQEPEIPDEIAITETEQEPQVVEKQQLLIEVHENRIIYNEAEVTLDGLQEILTGFAVEDIEVELKYNYAINATFEQVEAMLKENALTYVITYIE